MKKLSRFLIPLLVLSVVLCCFVAITSAEDAASTPAYRVTPIDADGNPTAEATTYEGKDFTAFLEDYCTANSGGIYTVNNLQVDLLSDVNWDKQGYIRNQGKFVLNLNGYKLSMNAESQGYFNLMGSTSNYTDTTFTINGAGADGKNGSIVSSKAKYMIYSHNSNNYEIGIYVNNVDFYSEASSDFNLFDFRRGFVYYTDCNFEGNVRFGISTNAGGLLTKVVFNRCVINSVNKESIFRIGKDAEYLSPAVVEFNNGTINAVSSYLVYVRANEGASAGANYVNARISDENDNIIKERRITVNASTINMPNAKLIRCVNDNQATPNVINLGLGTRILMSDSTVGSAVNTTLTTPAGSVNAQCGPNEKEYMIVNNGDVVTVNFYNSKDDAEPIATRDMAKGIEPCIVGQPALAKELYFDGDVLKKFGGWKNAQGNLVTTLTENVDLYRVADDVAYYATFSSTTPSLDRIVHAEFEDSNINNCFVSPVVLVQLYADCINDAGTVEKMITMPGAMTIDLGNHVLTHGSDKSHANSALRPANTPETKGTLTVKNGTVELDKSIFLYPRLGNSGAIVVTDVIFNMTGNATLLQAEVNSNSGGANYTFTNVTVNVNNGGTTSKNNVFNIDRTSNSTSSIYEFNNLTVRSDDGTKVNNVFENNKSKPDHQINFTIKNSTIDIPLADGGQIFRFYNTAATTITVESTDFNTHGAGKIFNLASNPNATININGIDMDRAEAWTGSAMPEATVKLDGETGDTVVAFGANADLPYTPALTSQCETVTWKFHNYSSKSYYKDGVTPNYYGDGIIFATTEEGKNLAGVVDPDWSPTDVTPAVANNAKEYTLELKLFTYVVTDAEGNILSHSFDTVIDGELFANLAAGNVLVLYSEIDAQCTQDITISPAKANTTLDLNGWILKNVYFKVQGSTTFNVKNGKLTSTNNSIFQLTTSSSKVNLNNVKCETGTGIIVDYRNGTLVAEDSNFTTNASVMSIGTQGTWVNARFEDCTFNAGAHFIVHNKAQNQSATIGVGVSVKGGSITAGNSLFYVGDREPFADSTFTLNFQEGVKINVKSGKYFNMMYDVAETVTFTNCWLNADPNTYVEGTVKPNVVYGSGMILRSTTDNTYLYRLTDYKLPVSVNLTLFTDFNLNLFINGNILEVYANGKKLVLENYNGSVKAALSGISADRAAENVIFTIVYNDGGIGVVLTRNYSILDYASALLVSDYSKDSKELIASIVRYIDAAYAYGGKQNDDLTGFLAANPGYLDAISTAESLPDLDALVSDAEYKDLAIAIDSAQLALSGDLKYILNLKESYTGTLTVNGESYSVTDGKYNGKSYVVIKLAAKDYLDGLTVTATAEEGIVSGTYDLAAYAVNMRGTKGDTLDDLLANLIAYVTEAKAYADFVAANGGNLI